MRVGLLGYGGWGSIHAASLAALDEHELVAIFCRGDASAQRAAATHPGVRIERDADRLLRAGDVDVIDVALPTHLHADAAIGALRAGKHVLLEKPMAGTLGACDQVIDAQRESGKLLSSVHELRLSHQWSAVKRAIDEGAIGDPRYALLNLFRFPYRDGAAGWRYDADTVGSWILEEPIHFFDLLLWYFEAHGAPRSVTAFGDSTRGSVALSESFTAVVRFAGGAYGVIAQSLAGFEHHQVVEVSGSSGALRSLWSGAMDRTDRPEYSVHLRRSGAAAAERLPVEGPSGELFEIGAWLRLALDGFARGEALYPAERERELVRLCLAAERSMREGVPVAL